MEGEPLGDADPALQLEMSAPPSGSPAWNNIPKGCVICQKRPNRLTITVSRAKPVSLRSQRIGVKSTSWALARCAYSHTGSQQHNLYLLRPKAVPLGLFFPACFSWPVLATYDHLPFFPGVLKNKITQAFTNFSHVSSAFIAGTQIGSRLFPNIELPMKYLFQCLFVTPSPKYSPLWLCYL